MSSPSAAAASLRRHCTPWHSADERGAPVCRSTRSVGAKSGASVPVGDRFTMARRSFPSTNVVRRSSSATCFPPTPLHSAFGATRAAPYGSGEDGDGAGGAIDALGTATTLAIVAAVVAASVVSTAGAGREQATSRRAMTARLTTRASYHG